MFSFLKGSGSSTEVEKPKIKQNTSFANFKSPSFLRKRLKTKTFAGGESKNSGIASRDSDSYPEPENPPSILNNILQKTATYLGSEYSKEKTKEDSNYYQRKSDSKRKSQSEYRSPSRDFRETWAL